ncbi:MAG: DUF1566 domain-containing protein [Thiothrix sp.]|nr:MAG: DUF1566 domain-containing protein [Thiothrix sp.]
MYKFITFALFTLVAFQSEVWSADQYCKIGLINATTPVTQFQDNKDGTVTDLKTKLIWKKCTEGQTWQSTTNTCKPDSDIALMLNWPEALDRAAQINNIGFANAVTWRLPNIKELSSIIENACYGPSINLTVFPDTPSGIFWSSTPYIGAGEYAWSVRFNYGQNSMNYKYDYYFARLVRDPNS